MDGNRVPTAVNRGGGMAWSSVFRAVRFGLWLGLLGTLLTWFTPSFIVEQSFAGLQVDPVVWRVTVLLFVIAVLTILLIKEKRRS